MPESSTTRITDIFLYLGHARAHDKYYPARPTFSSHFKKKALPYDVGPARVFLGEAMCGLGPASRVKESPAILGWRAIVCARGMTQIHRFVTESE